MKNLKIGEIERTVLEDLKNSRELVNSDLLLKLSYILDYEKKFLSEDNEDLDYTMIEKEFKAIRHLYLSNPEEKKATFLNLDLYYLIIRILDEDLAISGELLNSLQADQLAIFIEENQIKDLDCKAYDLANDMIAYSNTLVEVIKNAREDNPTMNNYKILKFHTFTKVQGKFYMIQI